MPEGTKNIEYLHSNIHKGRSAKIARKACENIEISTPHRVRQRAGALETAPTVAINARHNIDDTHACRLPVGAPIALTLTALTYTYLILRIFLWEIHIMQ
jgi:hypothetical protein